MPGVCSLRGHFTNRNGMKWSDAFSSWLDAAVIHDDDLMNIGGVESGSLKAGRDRGVRKPSGLDVTNAWNASKTLFGDRRHHFSIDSECCRGIPIPA